ncbi:hypothetical protein FQN50_005679 [Emmonsiellopsis sp. PD_5]|nr:hypothetical protein FQN50_005679 [Emmonsiellopsis sp. PD_5]
MAIEDVLDNLLNWANPMHTYKRLSETSHAMASDGQQTQPPSPSAEVQETMAAPSRIGSLPAELKVQLMTYLDVSSLRSLLRYLPDTIGSFRDVYYERKKSILNEILRERFSWEWTMIGGEDDWEPLEPLPSKYHDKVELVVRSCYSERSFFAEIWAKGEQVERPRDGPSNPTATEKLQKAKYKSAVNGGIGLLELLQDVQDEIKRMEKAIMTDWTTECEKEGKSSWVVTWMGKHLYRAMVILWKLHIVDMDKPKKYTERPSLDEGEEGKFRYKTQLEMNRLTEDEQQILLEFCEAMAASKDHGDSMPTEQTNGGREAWRLLLTGLEKAQVEIICTGGGQYGLPSVVEAMRKMREVKLTM